MRAALAILLMLALGGCLTHPRGDFAAISTRAIPAKMEIVKSRVEGKTCKTNAEPRFELAVEDALETVPEANALVDVEYRFDWVCLVVSGTAVRILD